MGATSKDSEQLQHLDSYPRSGKQLLKSIFDAAAPEQFVRTIPAQSLYLTARQLDLSSAGELIELVSSEQLRIMLDYDLWAGYQFSEDNFFDWLVLPESISSDDGDSTGLRILQRLLASIDLRILILMVNKYVEHHTFEEPSDTPPGVGFTTPDKGYTWITVKIEDSERNFAFTRLLALLFETSANLFYKILAAPAVSTPAVLEEEAFQDRTKRLESEGIPDMEQAAALCAPIPTKVFESELAALEVLPTIDDIAVVEPLIYSAARIEPLAGLVGQISQQSIRGGIEQFNLELTKLMNAAIVRWGVPAFESEEIIALAEKVRGAVNIGLQLAHENRSELPLIELYRAKGVIWLYRVGFSELMRLRALALKIKNDEAAIISSDSVAFACVACAREPFPVAPQFLAANGEIVSDKGTLLGGSTAFRYLKQVQAVGNIIAGIRVL